MRARELVQLLVHGVCDQHQRVAKDAEEADWDVKRLNKNEPTEADRSIIGAAILHFFLIDTNFWQQLGTWRGS